MLDDGVHWLCLLQLKEQLFHSLDGVVPAQVDCPLLNLRRRRQKEAVFPVRALGWKLTHLGTHCHWALSVRQRTFAVFG